MGALGVVDGLSISGSCAAPSRRARCGKAVGDKIYVCELDCRHGAGSDLVEFDVAWAHLVGVSRQLPVQRLELRAQATEGGGGYLVHVFEVSVVDNAGRHVHCSYVIFPELVDCG